MEDINVLVTGGGAPGAFGIIKLLDDFTITSCDVHPNTLGKHLASSYFTIPSGKDSSYIESLRPLLEKHKIDVVFPITTNELFPLSESKEMLNNLGVKVIVSNIDALKIANNKGQLLDHLAKNNINVPRYFRTSTLEEFKSACNHFKSQDFVFKPCVSNGSRGFRIIKNQVDKSDLLFNQKPNSTFISQEEAIDVLSSAPFPELLVTEYLPGQEYSVDCLVENGKTILVIPRKRIKLNNGISVEGLIENNQTVISYCHEILSTLELHGPIGIQVKMDSNGIPKILEINPRIQGTSVACAGAGANLAKLCVLQTQRSIEADCQNLNVKWGTRFIRHYDEVYF